MRVSFAGEVYEFDLNKHQRVELHKGWDQYGNGSISLYGSVTPQMVLEKASYDDVEKVVLVRLNKNKLAHLHTELDDDCSFEVITYQDIEGQDAVCNSLELIMNAVQKELSMNVGFELIGGVDQIVIRFLQNVDISLFFNMLQNFIRLNLPLRKLLMQVSSAKEILEYVGNMSAYNKLLDSDEYDSVKLCQFKKYYGLAKDYYVENSGWFRHCVYRLDIAENSIVVSNL